MNSKINKKTPNGGKAWTLKEITDHIERRSDEFEGYLPNLQDAAGALMLGHLWGYQMVRVCNSFNTIKKYEKALNLEFRDVVPTRTELTGKIWGVKMADKFDHFWQAISSGTIGVREGAVVSDEPLPA